MNVSTYISAEGCGGWLWPAEPSEFPSGQTKFAKLAYRRALQDFLKEIE